MARVWNPQKVIEALRAYRASDRPSALDKRELACLRRAAQRYFGNWQSAMRAAGITPITGHRWSAQRVIEAIHEAFPEGLSDEQNRAGKELLVAAAYRYLGSWRKALIAAGLLAPNETIPRPRKWTTKRLIEFLQDAYVQGVPMVSTRFKAIASIAINRFGSWSEALKAAGITAGSPAKPCRRWTPDKVLREIRARHRQIGRVVPLHLQPGLASAARRYFGSWLQAKIAAGVCPATDLPKLPTKWSKKRVIREIQARQRQSLSLCSKDVANRRLYGAAYRHFGSWRKALRSAGIPGIPPPRQKRSRGQVVHTIKVWNAKKARLGAKDLPRGLQCAMYRHFGSASAARVAAGLPAGNLITGPKRTWTPQRVLEAMHAWQEQGKSLRKVWKECGGLYFQAKKQFGSWRQALQAAGLERQPDSDASPPMKKRIAHATR